MNNLERKLIELTFPTVNVDSLMEIIVATPNSRVATEILCGVYQEPEFVKDKLSPQGIARTFVSYDKWTEQVQYMYLQEKTEHRYFPNSVDKSTITLENFEELCCSYNGDKTYGHRINTGVMETRTDWCSVSDWLRLKDNNFELSAEELETAVL